MGIQINGVNDIISATDGGFSLSGAELTNLSQVNVTGVGTFANLVVSGNVSIAGTLTYEDVTNVDSIGIVTARTGVRIDAGGIVVVGVTTVAAGTTALPSISPTGDSNTGIFFPSADTIAFAEGGAEAARFDSSGRLLIGTSTTRSNLFAGNAALPAYHLVEGALDNGKRTSAFVYGAGSNSGPLLVLAAHASNSVGGVTAVTNGWQVGTIDFQGADGTNFVPAAQIAAVVDGTPGANDMPGRLVFSTTADGASSLTERMRISNNGALGVGDNNPASNALRASFRGPVNGTESALPVVSIVRTNNIGGGTGVAETGLDVQIPNTFNGAGVVKGINVFAKHNLGGTAYGIFAESTGGGNAPIIRYAGYFKVTQTDTNGSAVNHAVYAQANSTVTVSNNGFAVGVTAETNDYVKNQNFRAVSLYTGASTQTVLSIARNGSAIGSITTLATATSYMTSASSGLLGVDATTIAFQTNSSERARIDSSGRLLIGTSTALVAGGSLTPAFQIAGGDQNSCTQMIRGAGSLQPSLAFTRSNGSIASPTTVTSGDGLGGILFEGYDGSNPIRAALITAAVDGTPGTNDMPGRLVFSTTADGASSPTERMRLDSSGRLLVGTTSARNLGGIGACQFTLEGTGYNSSSVAFVNNENNVQPPYLILGKSRGGSVGSSTIVQSGDSIGQIVFAGADGTDIDSRAAEILCSVDGTPGANDMPGRLVFSTTADGAATPTERMRITNQGYLYSGVTSAEGINSAQAVTGERIVNINSDTLSDQGASHMARQGNSANEGTAQSCYLAYYRDAIATGPGAFFKGYRGTAPTNGTIRIKINSDGNITNSNNSYGSLSDAKLKENIVDASSQWNDIKNIRVRNYNFKEETGQQTHRQIGLIAQEVEPISPGLVVDFPDTNDEVTKTINYSVLYMKAVKALQEAMERIEQLEQRLTDAGIA
jgi:hypothetical protein